MHVGIIMDGNRTWAKRFGLPWIDGHKKGVEAVEKIIKICPDLGIKTLTLYAFSTENFNRSKEQVDGILNIIASSANLYKPKMIKQGVKVELIGDLTELTEKTKAPLQNLVEETKNGDLLTLQLAVNYGGRDEIVRAVKKTILLQQDITEESLSRNLDSSLQPDIIVRTGGQMRISNFLLWQGAYSELFFVEKNWPDFTGEDLAKIVEDFKTRTRKFGK